MLIAGAGPGQGNGYLSNQIRVFLNARLGIDTPATEPTTLFWRCARVLAIACRPRAVCAQHGKDESDHQAHAPDAVWCSSGARGSCPDRKAGAEYNAPVIAFSRTGTSLEGHVAGA